MVTAEQIRKRNNEAMRRWRLKASNREKAAIYGKDYRQRPEVKERHKIKMAQYRKLNPDVVKKISIKSRNKNKDRYNETRRIKYKTDIDYRYKKIQADILYKESGKRKIAMAKNAIKLREKVSEWRKENKEWIKKYRKKYVANVWNPHEREQRENLDKSYVIKILKKEMDYVVKSGDIPDELIELRRLQIKTRRKLKQKIK